MVITINVKTTRVINRGIINFNYLSKPIFTTAKEANIKPVGLII